MDLKKTLKALRLNESTISMVLGAVVIVVVGILVINYFRRTDTGTTLPGTTTDIEEPVEFTQGEQKYTVKAGDSLWSIAESKYGSGYNWVDISRANSMTNPGLITEGDELTLPDVEAKMATKTEVVEEDATAISGATYTVETDDNLWDIAVRAYGDGYKWVEIASANNLKNPNIIHKGNVLSLPK